MKKSQESILKEVSEELKERLNENGYSKGLFRIECSDYKQGGLKETINPVPLTSKEGLILVVVREY